MLKYRLISAFVLIPIVIAALFLLPPVGFAIVTLVVCMLAAWEWGQFSGFTSRTQRVWLAVLCGFILAVMLFTLPEYHHDVRYMMSVGHAIYRHSIFMEHRVQFVSEREFVSEDIIFDIDFLSHVRSVCYLPDCLHYYVVNPYSLSHTYDDAKYHKMVNLSRIIKERLAKIYSEEKYYLHYLRSVFFLLRNTVMRMVLAGETDQKIKRILEEKLYQELLSNYPYQRMDLKHRIVFFLLKYKCILLLKILFKSVKS